jgi:uncharacterized protein YegP (UPF0339 family)
MPRTAKIEIFPVRGTVQTAGVPDAHAVRLRASNGEIVMSSELYTTKADAKKAAQRLKRIAANAVVTEAAS